MKKQTMMALLRVLFSFLVVIPLSLLAATASPLTVAAAVQQTDLEPLPPVTVMNINTATAQELAMGLVGIGLKKAQAIVDYREQHGTFTHIEQLQEVKGIAPSLIERNRDRLKL